MSCHRLLMWVVQVFCSRVGHVCRGQVPPCLDESNDHQDPQLHMKRTESWAHLGLLVDDFRILHALSSVHHTERRVRPQHNPKNFGSIAEAALTSKSQDKLHCSCVTMEDLGGQRHLHFCAKPFYYCAPTRFCTITTQLSSEEPEWPCFTVQGARAWDCSR